MLKIPADRVFFMSEEQEEMFNSLPENQENLAWFSGCSEIGSISDIIGLKKQ